MFRPIGRNRKPFGRPQSAEVAIVTGILQSTEWEESDTVRWLVTALVFPSSTGRGLLRCPLVRAAPFRFAEYVSHVPNALG
jgi:hypothetical protein